MFRTLAPPQQLAPILSDRIHALVIPVIPVMVKAVPISMNVPEQILVLQLRLAVILSDRTPVRVTLVIPVMEEHVLT